MKKPLAAIFGLLSLQAIAQNTEQELDPVTITASLQPRPVSQTGRNIITYKGDDIARMPVHSLDELLRYLPGVEVQMRGPMGAQSDIVLRGGTFQQVLVLVDGVRVNDPNTGHFSSYIPIAPVEIERVEVLKGASSAIYGSEAVGGVVHVITKTFAARRKQDRWQVRGLASAGEYELFHANAGAHYQESNTAVSGGWLSNNTRGQLQRGTRGFVYNNTASVSVNHFLNDHWQLAIRGAYDNRDFSAQNFYTTFASDTADEKVRTAWSQFRVAYNGGRHRLNIDGGYKAVRDEYLYNSISVANLNKSYQWQATVTDEWKAGARTTVVSGVQFINRSIRSNDRGTHSVPQGGVFAVVNHELFENFIINPALRLDWNERSGAELIPQINLSYRPGAIQWRASAGKTIRDADFTECYNNYNKPVVASGRIGDPNLQAERSFSYEAGADYFISKKIKLSGTFFQRYHKKLIDYVTTAYDDMPRKDNLIPNGTYALARNIAAVTTTGGEVDIRYQEDFSGHNRLYASAGLVWLDSRSSEGTPSFYISSHAKFLTNFFIEYSCGRFQVSVNGLYKRRDEQAANAIHTEINKDYFLVNAKAAVFTSNRKINIFARLDNATDASYSDLLGAVMPGRWLSGGMEFSLSR